VTVRELTAADAALLDQLIERYPFKPYRNYRLLSRRNQADVMRAEIARVQQTAGSFAILVGERDDCAVAVGRPLAWDTGFFGVQMGRLDCVLRSAGATEATVRDAIDEALDRFRSVGIQHVSMKLDVADVEVMPIVEDSGFRLMDALVAYIAHPRRPGLNPVKEVGHVRLFSPGDTEQILEITREAYRGYKGRFQVDPNLPRNRSDEFYLEWARKCCSGEMADRIYVADDRQGRVFGWASVKRAEPVSSVGSAEICSGSLGACRPDRPGAYASLIRTAAMDNHAAGVLTEAFTQHANFAMVRVLEAVGAHYARADYTFHAWLA
jgi:hypothetical protein